MRSTVTEVIKKISFEQALFDIKANIVSNGFLLIHEINTQQIMEKHGFKIPQLRQLLFFHPNYMKQILEGEPLAVIEVPLKIVIREVTVTKTSISYENPVEKFIGYVLPDTFAIELVEKMHRILDLENN